MNKSLPRIPIPARERWRDVRLHWVPPIVLISAALVLAVLWKDHVAAPTLIGQAEAVEANVSCYKAGMLAELNVARFQKVKAGDVLGQVLVTDPKVLASSLAVIQAEIEMLRADVRPLALQQRTAMDYSQLRLDWMRQRSQLAASRVNLQLATTELRRTEELFQDKIVSQRVYDQAKANQDRLQQEVEELSRLVAEQEEHFKSLQGTNGVEVSKITDEPLRTAIAAQESKLRLTEAELSPITLRAPVDGTVNMVYHRSGEAITAGEPIMTIAAADCVRIIGYLRPPITQEPAVGMPVEVRTRGPRREVGAAAIVEVGTRFESVSAPLQMARLPGAELGLPIGINMPPNLKLRPGEVVDLFLREPKRN